MLPPPLRRWLSLTFSVGLATLVRSVAFNYWITILAAGLLMVGAAAAARGRTWGIGVLTAMSVAFVTACVLGIGPLWFMFVALVAIVPQLKVVRALARFDRGAMVLGAGLAILFGSVGAAAWAMAAPSLFEWFPFMHPRWGSPPSPALCIVAALGAVGAFALPWSEERREIATKTGLAGVRVAASSAPAPAERLEQDELTLEDDAALDASRSIRVGRRA